MSDQIKAINHIDRVVHEPARLAIMAALSACESADFQYLFNLTGLSKGNLSAQLRKLEEAGYVRITKSFKGNYPYTTAALTKEGRRAFRSYWEQYQSLAKHINPTD
jgi:DNA-binding transcriptional ArsR family regulator